jgi:hypothetical protein
MNIKIYSSIARERRSSSGELNKATGIIETPKTIDPSIITVGSLIKLPEDLSEFEDRLGVFLYDLQDLFYGITYEIETGKTLKRDMSPESLVDILLVYEKRLQKGASLPSKTLETYSILKLCLEKDVYLFEKDSYLLGIERDRSGLSSPQKNAIAVQCAAQVLWHIEGNKILTIKAMVKILNSDKEYPFFELLELGRFNDERTIRNWVRAVCPIPMDQRKKRRSKDAVVFNTIVPVPDIFTDGKISFPRLRFALLCLSRVMKALGSPLSEIGQSKPIALLIGQLKFYPKLYAKDWIKEGYSSNGSIFT